MINAIVSRSGFVPILATSPCLAEVPLECPVIGAKRAPSAIKCKRIQASANSKRSPEWYLALRQYQPLTWKGRHHSL